jgi:hypothetical protein
LAKKKIFFAQKKKKPQPARTSLTMSGKGVPKRRGRPPTSKPAQGTSLFNYGFTATTLNNCNVVVNINSSSTAKKRKPDEEQQRDEGQQGEEDENEEDDDGDDDWHDLNPSADDLDAMSAEDLEKLKRMQFRAFLKTQAKLEKQSSTEIVEKVLGEADSTKIEKESHGNRFKPATVEAQAKVAASAPSVAAAVRALQDTPMRASASTMYRRMKGVHIGAKNPGGRAPIPEVFEVTVLSNLLAGTAIQKEDGSKAYEVRATTIYSYMTVQDMMLRTRLQDCFQERLQGQDLEDGWKMLKDAVFSNGYISKWMERMGISRHRVSSTIKEQPPPEHVQQMMQALQEEIEAKGYALEEIVSADETGVVLNTSILYKYDAHGVNAAVVNNDDKNRVTLMLFASAAGIMGPIMYIVKCSSNSKVQDNVRVLRKLCR